MPYFPFPSFVLRTPLFPVNIILDLYRNSSVDNHELKEICRKKIVLEALFLASPDLYWEVNKWLNGQVKNDKKEERLIGTLLRYLTRMASRCTPFGLFAGTSTGVWDEKTTIKIDDHKKIHRHTRLDMNWLCSLSQELDKDETLINRSSLFPNSSLYKVGDKIRYVEYRYKKGKREHHIVSVENSEFLEKVINVASKGSTISTLTEALIDKEISQEEAKEFIFHLIENQVLVSDLEPPVTGTGFLGQIIQKFNATGLSKSAIAVDLEYVYQNITNNEAKSPEIDHYLKIRKRLENIDVEIDPKYLFQCDMVKPVQSCSLNRSLSDEILTGIEILSKLTFPQTESNLGRYKEAFKKRYETREIPLMIALDAEMGIGYGQHHHWGDISPLVDDIHVPVTNEKNFKIEWNNILSLLRRKVTECERSGSISIEISKEDIKTLATQWKFLNHTFYSMVRILDYDDTEKETFKILMGNAGGSSAANLLGRFCHTDRNIYDLVKGIAKKEQEMKPDAFLAEIVHLTESRTGNVLLRPAIRKYEIPYLGRSGLDKRLWINTNDLHVSIRNNRFFLRSKKLNREIIPRLTTAHNFSHNALPVYQFLCDLQYQDHQGFVSFSWGPLFQQLDFLPRVTFDRITFSPATWFITQEEIKPMLNMTNDKVLEKVDQWRINRMIPPLILLPESDNELLIDLRNIDSVGVLFSLVKNKPSFHITEFLFNPDFDLVTDGKANYVNEFIFTYYKNDNN